jgi:hypothetical protein
MKPERTLHVPSLAALALAALALGACGGDDEPASHSAPVGINLKADSDKVVGTNVTDEKNITTESGNPYGAFVTEAQNVLGAAPGRIEVVSVSALMGANSMGVSALNEIFNGRLDAMFEMTTTGDTIPVAHAIIDADTQGRGPVELEIDFDPTTLAPANYVDLVGGNFKVVYSGVVASGYSTLGAKADLQLTFTFEAFAE